MKKLVVTPHCLYRDSLTLNKYGSYFKFVVLLSGNINLNPEPTTPKRNDL